MSAEQARKELEDGDESASSSFSDKMDEMVDDELIKDERDARKKYNDISRKNATDRAGDIDIDQLNSKQEEADDTVFIDNLPKDETSIRNMIKVVNVNIRELER